MRANEFALDEGKASRRKQASMNAQRRMANAPQQSTAMPASPTASTGTSAPAVAPAQAVPTIANPVNPNVKPGGSKEAQAFRAQQQPATDWNALNQATAPAKPSAGSSMMNTLKQTAMSAGKGIANKFSTQGKISASTDKIFMDKFIKDMATAEQISTGLRGEPFDVKAWVGKYLAQNKWDAGEQQAALDSAIASNNKKAMAKSMAAIGKYNNLGSTINAKTASAQATAAGTGAMGQMASQLAKAPSTTTQPVKLGKHMLDPKDPVDAKMISMLRQQGKL